VGEQERYCSRTCCCEASAQEQGRSDSGRIGLRSGRRRLRLKRSHKTHGEAEDQKARTGIIPSICHLRDLVVLSHVVSRTAELSCSVSEHRDRLRFSGLDAPGAKNDSVSAFYELPELFAIGNREQCRISSEGHNILFPYITKNCFQKGLLQVEGRPSRTVELSYLRFLAGE